MLSPSRRGMVINNVGLVSIISSISDCVILGKLPGFPHLSNGVITAFLPCGGLVWVTLVKDSEALGATLGTAQSLTNDSFDSGHPRPSPPFPTSVMALLLFFCESGIILWKVAEYSTRSLYSWWWRTLIGWSINVLRFCFCLSSSKESLKTHRSKRLS